MISVLLREVNPAKALKNGLVVGSRGVIVSTLENINFIVLAREIPLQMLRFSCVGRFMVHVVVNPFFDFSSTEQSAYGITQNVLHGSHLPSNLLLIRKAPPILRL